MFTPIRCCQWRIFNQKRNWTIGIK